MKNLCWLATGGTIASRPSSNGLVPGFTAQEMLDMLPELKKYGSIDCYDIMNLDSTNLQPHDWQFIARCIEKYYTQYDGFVITHGTDTLSWTSCALSCMLENPAKPIVVIGSQLTLEEESTDAKENLNAAFAVAASKLRGVYAVCGGQIISGLWAKKIYSEDLRSIQSVNMPPVATFCGSNITWSDFVCPPAVDEFKVHYELEEKVAQVKIMPGLDGEILAALADLGYKGIVLEAYGAGGIPFAENENKDIDSAVKRLTEQGIVCVCVTQCLYDGVHMNRYEVGIKAVEAGIIPAGKYSAEAATVKLMTALGRKMTFEQIKQLF